MKKYLFLFLAINTLYVVCTQINPSFEKITILTESHGRAKGPHAVIRSLVTGLHQLNIPHNHNPRNVNEVGDVVVVLSGISQLKKAISWKRNGVIKKLLAGPNLLIRSNHENYILASPEIDHVIVPCEWARINFEEDDERLKGKIMLWPSGVDPNFWQPSLNKIETKRVLIYWKSNTQNFCNQVCEILKKYNYIPLILKYGSYNINTFKTMLSKSDFAVFITQSESQGIALAEAWAMNIPTLVWNPKKLIAYGKSFTGINSCPYLTPQTGLDWKTFKEFENTIQNFTINFNNFTPRKWVLENMTDVISVTNLIKVIEG